MVNSKKFKKLIAFISAVCMTSVCMLSVSADTVADNTQSIVQQDETTTIENELLDLGFSQEEVNLIIENVSTEEIQSVLNLKEGNINSRATSTTHSYHLQDSNGKNINTYTNVSQFNTDNTCGSLACAITLKYHKDYKGVSIPKCTNANFYNFYRSIVPYVDTSARWSTLSTIESGLAEFLSDNNIKGVGKPTAYFYEPNNRATSLKKMVLLTKTFLNVNEPVIASGKYPTSTGRVKHTVVIQGMTTYYDSDGNLTGAKVEVNNGWGSIETVDYFSFAGVSGYGIVYIL